MATRNIFTGLVLTACLLWAQGGPPLKRQQLVTLNVVAFDGHGQPVGDLTSDDFQIQDQGKRQQIVFFRHNESKPRQHEAAAPHQYSNRSGATVGQATVVLLDLLNANLSDRGSGWEGIDRALERLETGDNLYVYLLTAEAKLYPVHGLPGSGGEEVKAGSPWTQQIRPLIDSAVRKVNRLKPVDALDPVIRVRQTYQALGSMAAQLAAIPGRKSIVWITHGVPMNFRTLTNDWVDMTEQLRLFCGGLNRAGVAMYTVDQGGPGSIPTGNEGPGYQSQDTLQQMAELTGGRAYPGNNAEQAIPAAIASARGSYLILYEPVAENWDRKFHKIRVNCTRKGIHVQAQQGYYATPREPIDNQMRAAFEAASMNPMDAPGIGITASVSPGAEHALQYQMRVDGSDVLLLHEGDHENGQLAISFVGMTGGQAEPSTPSLVNVSLTKEQYEAALKEGIPFSYEKAIGKGIDKVRIVVMDLSSGETGALTIPVAPAGGQ